MQDQNGAFAYKIERLEIEVAAIKVQLERYVPVKENELQLRYIKEALERIERDVQLSKGQLEEMTNKVILAEREAQKRDSAQRESQDALQIKVLWGTVSTVMAVLIAVLVGYITHFFH